MAMAMEMALCPSTPFSGILTTSAPQLTLARAAQTSSPVSYSVPKKWREKNENKKKTYKILSAKPAVLREMRLIILVLAKAFTSKKICHVGLYRR
jgi:hypothetical protein